MSDQPSLFDALAPLRTVHLPPRSQWVRSDEDLIALWREHGIPADLSTVEHACAMLFILHDEYQALLADLDHTEAAS